MTTDQLVKQLAQLAQLAKAGVPLPAIPAIMAGMNGQDLPKGRSRGRFGGRKGHRFGPTDRKWTADELAQRDAETVAKFRRKGYTVTLKDRNDPAKPYDVRPFGRQETVDSDGNVVPATGWIAMGRVVRKGQKAVNGLFHITQTDPLPAKTS